MEKLMVHNSHSCK